MAQQWQVESPRVIDIGGDGELVRELEVGIVGGHVDVVTAVHPDGTLTVVGGNVSNAVRQRVIDPDTAVQNGHSISGYVSPPGA